MVWNILLKRQLKAIEGRACQEFLTGLNVIEEMIQSFSDFKLLSDQLEKTTGWQLISVPGLLESDDYFQHLAKKEFPVANFLRDREHLDYLEEPDAWHDVFGHLPLLTNPIYSRFVETLSKKVVATEGTQRQKLINLYWYTIEVGLCQENGQRKAYGSALLSSFVEIQYALSNKPKVHPFDWKTVTQSNVKIDEIQNNLFEITSFNFLEQISEKIDSSILTMPVLMTCTT